MNARIYWVSLDKYRKGGCFSGQSVVHLINNLVYQNWTRHHFLREVSDGGRVHVGGNEY